MITRWRSLRVWSLVLASMALLLNIAAPVQAGAVSTQGKPTVMVILQDKVAGEFGTTGWEVPTQAELTLIAALTEAGFPVVDAETARSNLDQAKGLRLLEADNRSAAALGLQHGAQISIIGTAISKPAGAKLLETQMQSLQATVTARAIANDTARVLASGSANAAVAHIDEVAGGVQALDQATQKLAASLVPQLVLATEMSDDAPRAIRVNISGLKSYRHLDYLLYFFETKVAGISEVYLREFTNTVANVSMQYNDQSAVLARKVAKQKFKGFRLEPTQVTDNRIDFSVVGD
jgi:hypothetical protein